MTKNVLFAKMFVKTKTSFMIIFCFLSLSVLFFVIGILKKNDIYNIEEYIKNNPVAWIMLEIILCTSPIFWESIVVVYKKHLSSQKSLDPSVPTFWVSGIISPTDLNKFYFIDELIKNKSFIINNQTIILTNETLYWLQNKNKKHEHSVKAITLMLYQKVIWDRSIIAFEKKISQIFSSSKKKHEIILTGESGCGKSVFANIFIEKCSKYRCYYFNNMYGKYELNEFINKINPRENTIIFFDQFEKALENNVLSWFSSLKLPGNVTLVYIIREDKIITLIRKRQHLANSIFYLLFKRNDINSLNIRHRTMFPIEYSTFKYSNRNPELQIANNLLECVKKGKLTVVAYELICGFLKNYNMDFDNVYSLNELRDNPEKIIYIYLDKWVNQFYNKETGTAILYLLSDYQKYHVNDIQNATLCKTVENDKIIAFGLINQINSKREYKFAHEYIAEVAKHYCENSTSFSRIVAENIDYYRNHINWIEVNIIEKRNKNLHNEQSELLLKSSLGILLLGVIFGSFYKLLSMDSYQEYFSMIAVLINCMLSTYYIYYYSFFFLRLYDNFILAPIVLGGTALVLLAIFIPGLWAVFLGVEAIILSIYLLLVGVRKKIDVKAIITFRKSGAMTFAFGIITVFLGIVFYILVGKSHILDFSSLVLKYSYFILYFTFIFMSNIAHINFLFLYERIGLANRLIKNNTLI